MTIKNDELKKYLKNVEVTSLGGPAIVQEICGCILSFQ